MTTPAASDYHDRKTGLVLFGVLEIAIGFICVLLILLMLAGLALGGRGPNPPPGLSSVGTAIAVYALLAGGFVWLGIGSILARRWARAILLCGSAVALAGGTLGCAAMAFILPHMFDAIAQQGQRPIQPGALMMVKAFTAAFMVVVYIVIPGALFLFYRSPHVKRTCEARDPVERWTDLCPLPVLAFSMVMGLAGVALIGLMARFRGFPVFGIFVAGGWGVLLSLLMGAVMLYLAWGFYRLRIRAWWVALALQVLWALSSFATFWRTDVADLYARMGADPRTAAVSAQLLGTPALRWMIALSVVCWMVWLLCLRRYFDAPEVPPLLSGGGAQPPPL
jgi:hypothetical protein